MLDEQEARARQEALWLVREFGDDASLYAAMKAEKAIAQRDFSRCARWKRVLEILDAGIDAAHSLPRGKASLSG
jgi:hypothetical protein